MTRRARRALRRLVRIAPRAFTWLLILAVASAALPAELLPAPLPSARKADAETLTSPRFVSAALMPNGQVGLAFQNVSGTNSETRFMRYTGEHALGSSVQLSTAAPWYPQLAVLGTILVAAYVDTRSPNVGKLILRTSTDSGTSWSSESYPFGSETFNAADFAPRLVASHAGTTLYLFTAVSGARPQYRSTTDLSTWTSAAAAGDLSMRVTSANNCGNAGAECYRAHAFGFMETATSGSWVYVSKSDSGYGQSGRGTQIGALGGSWSTQVDHGGSGGISGGGDSTATTFLDRGGNVYFLRALERGEGLYYRRSTDGGNTWGPVVYAYTAAVSNYTTAAPVGLYVPGYALGEYAWFAGFGGSEDSLRVAPLWSAPQPFASSGTARLVGSAGSDLDAASAYPFNFSDTQSLIGAGGYTTSHTDLALSGRLLPLVFGRSYNSADEGRAGVLGPGWSHSFEWSITENGTLATLRRGGGATDRFTRNPDGTYTSPPGVSDTLSRHTDGTFTLTTRDQLMYELGVPSTGYATVIANGTPTGYWRLGETSGTTAADAGPGALSGTYSGAYGLGAGGAIGADTNAAVAFSGGYADMGSPSALNISGTALSVEFWAQGNPGAYNYFVSHTDGASAGYALYTGNDATIHFYLGMGGGLHISSGVGGIWDGAWHHVAAVYDAVAMRIYVDGLQSLSESETRAITGYTGNFRLAGYNGGGYGFSGTLDEVAVYSRALSASEISDHYANGTKPTGVLMRIHEPAGNQITLSYTGTRITTLTDTVGRQVALAYDAAGRLRTLTDPAGRIVRYGYDSAGRLAQVWDQRAMSTPNYPAQVQAASPAAYWRLGESSGTSAADAGPNSDSGTYSGGYTLGQSGAPKSGGATSVSFNGASGKVAAGATGIPTGTAARTVEAWIKPGTSGGTIFATNAASGQKFIVQDALISGTWNLFTDGVNAGNNLTLSGAQIPAANSWSHVAFVFEGAANTWRYYLNGELAASGSFPVTINTAAATSATIADRLDYSQPFGGNLQEVAVYPSALSAAQILAHYLAASPSWQYAYDGATRHLTTLTDPDGRAAVTNAYDTLGRLVSQKDGRNKETVLSYSGSTLTLTDPRLVQTVQTFDARSRLLTTSNTLDTTTLTTTFTYDACGNRSSLTDRRGNRTDYAFDSGCKGNLLTLTQPQLNPSTPRFVTTWTYDTKNNPTLRTDAKGFTTSWTYDGTSNVRLSETRQIDATTSATTKWIYADSGNPGLPTRIVAPRGNTTGTPDNTYSTVLAYDSSGNLASSTDADGNKTTYAYDSLGRRTAVVDPDGNVTGGIPADHTWSTAYDALDRVTSETDPLGHATTYAYDGAGHRLTLTDKNANVTTYTYDQAGRLATVAQKPDPTGQPTLVYTTAVTRDDNGNATAVTQGNGVVTSYSYDALNRMTSMTTHPATGTDLVTGYTLDANGNVTTRTTADGVSTTYAFDNLDRLTQISATGLSTISYAYDELSRRASMTDVTGTTTYAYDRMGRLTQAAQPSGTTAYAYDLDSDRTTLTYPSPSSVTYSFSNAGRLSSLSDWGSRITSYTYSPAGLARTVTLPNSMVTTYTYDRAQRLTNLTNVMSGTTITSHAYTLDSEGNRTALTEFVSGITSGASDSFGFTYDGLERLTAVTTTNAETFSLDGASNITARTGPAKTFTIDNSNRPTSDGTNTLTWSAADRLTGRGADTFGFDPLDRLTSSTVGGTSRTYTYNGDGLLQSRTTAGSTMSLLWDPAISPSRLLVSGSDRIVYGLGPLYGVNGSTVTTYARDGQKSVRAEINGSSVVGSWRYRAYGETAQSSGASAPSILGYAGQLLDPSGLYYMRARWYDAANARFLSRDPLTEIAALATAFGYVADPLRMSDPTGLSPADENDKPVPSWRNWEREVGGRLSSEYPGSDYEIQYNRAIRDVDGEVMRDSRGVVRRPDFQVFRGGRLIRVVEAAEGTPDYLLGTRKTQQIEGLRDIASRQGENPEVTIEFRVSTSPVFRLAGRAAGPISIIILYLQTRDQFRQLFEPPAPRTIAG